MLGISAHHWCIDFSATQRLRGIALFAEVLFWGQCKTSSDVLWEHHAAFHPGPRSPGFHVFHFHWVLCPRNIFRIAARPCRVMLLPPPPPLYYLLEISPAPLHHLGCVRTACPQCWQAPLLNHVKVHFRQLTLKIPNDSLVLCIPSHREVSKVILTFRESRVMEKLKRSLSFRKKKDHVPECSKPHQWQEDERKVREGTCSFQVRVSSSWLFLEPFWKGCVTCRIIPELRLKWLYFLVSFDNVAPMRMIMVKSVVHRTAFFQKKNQKKKKKKPKKKKKKNQKKKKKKPKKKKKKPTVLAFGYWKIARQGVFLLHPWLDAVSFSPVPYKKDRTKS